MKIKTKQTGVFLLLFVLTNIAWSQTFEKGGKLLFGNLQSTQNLKKSSQNRLQTQSNTVTEISPGIGLFLSPHFLLGTQINLSHFSSNNGVVFRSRFFFNPSVFCRFYFNPKSSFPLKFFASSQFIFNSSAYENFGFSDSSFFEFRGGVGVDIFLTSNLIWSSQWNQPIWNSLDDISVVGWESGLYLYLSKDWKKGRAEKVIMTMGKVMLGATIGKREKVVEEATIGNSSYKVTSQNFLIQSQIGEFVFDRLMLGAGLGLHQQRQELEVDNDNVNNRFFYRNITLTFIPFLRYYISPISNRWWWFTEVGFRFANVSILRESFIKDKAYSRGWNLALGLNMFLNNRSAFELKANYDRIRTDGNIFFGPTATGNDGNRDVLIFSLGYQYFLSN